MRILGRADLGIGPYGAAHDPSRPQRLLESTLDVDQSMGIDRTRAAILAAAGSLLRSRRSR